MQLKFYFRLEEDQTTIAVANDEIQDLTAWLKETETLLCATPRTTDLNTAKTVLGKLKVSINLLNILHFTHFEESFFTIS